MASPIDGDARVRPVSNPGNILWDGAVVYVVYICDPLYCMNIKRFQIEDIDEIDHDIATKCEITNK